MYRLAHILTVLGSYSYEQILNILVVDLFVSKTYFDFTAKLLTVLMSNKYHKEGMSN